MDLEIEFAFRPPFDKMLEPIKEDISKINRAMKVKSDKTQNLIAETKSHIQEIFGCGFSDDVILDESLSKNIQEEDISESQNPEKIADTEKSASDFSNADLPLKNPSNMSTYSNNGSFLGIKV